MSSAMGVRVVYVEALPGAKIDGCAMVIDGYPVIGLSGRGKRLDKVLFTLLHEIAHILRGHVDATHLIVEDLDDKRESETEQEKEANDEAALLEFPEGFPPIPGRTGAAWVDRAAEELGVARILVGPTPAPRTPGVAHHPREERPGG